jgi:hypothetical protein
MAAHWTGDKTLHRHCAGIREMVGNPFLRGLLAAWCDEGLASRWRAGLKSLGEGELGSEQVTSNKQDKQARSKTTRHLLEIIKISKKKTTKSKRKACSCYMLYKLYVICYMLYVMRDG